MPFDAKMDGQAAYLALKSQLAGPDKLQEVLRKQKQFFKIASEWSKHNDPPIIDKLM
jgi:hypothetical protein